MEMFENNGWTFSENLEHTAQLLEKIEDRVQVFRGTQDNQEYYEIRSIYKNEGDPPPTLEVRVLIDSQMGFNPVRLETNESVGGDRKMTEITAWRWEKQNDIYIPTRYTYQSLDRSGEVRFRRDFGFLKSEVNEPLPANRFSIDSLDVE
jgi:hypothetical protein